jgi:hypothetical protein
MSSSILFDNKMSSSKNRQKKNELNQIRKWEIKMTMANKSLYLKVFIIGGLCFAIQFYLLRKYQIKAQ